MQKLTREHLAQFRFPSDPQLAPQGRHLAYRLAEVDCAANRYPARIRVYDTETGRDFALTSGPVGQPLRFIDATTLSFVAEREENGPGRAAEGEPETKLYRISLEGGEAELWLRLPYAVKDYHVVGEDELLLLIEETPLSRRRAALSEEEKRRLKTELEDEADYVVLEEAPYWENGASYTSAQRQRLYRYRIAQQELLPLVECRPEEQLQLMDFDRARGRAAYLRFAQAPTLELFQRLFVLDLNTGEQREIAFPHPQMIEEALFGAEALYVFASDARAHGLNQNGSLYVLEDGDTEPRVIAAAVSPWNSVGTDVFFGGGRSMLAADAGVYTVLTEETDSYIYFIARDGTRRRLSACGGAVGGLAPAPAGDAGAELYFVALRGLKGPELYALKGGEERALTRHNAWLEDFALSRPERLDFAWAGRSLRGFVLKPANCTAGRRYPGILTIHGGPKTVYGDVLHHEIQLLAAAGYFVFYTNPPGSDGYGDDWADIRGRYGEEDYACLMHFVDCVAAAYPELDAARLGVMGGSYGGFMTNWIIGHTQRFKAAVTQRSIANWFSMYGISDIGYYFTEDQTQADPWKDAEKLWRHSPLKYAPQMRTPTLIIHADEDYRCPLAEGQQLFTALKLHEVPSRMVIFKGENHELSRSGKPRHRLRRLREIEAWLGAYLKPEDAPEAQG